MRVSKYDVRYGVSDEAKWGLILACRETLLSYLMWLVQRFDSPPRQGAIVRQALTSVITHLSVVQNITHSR